jgi:hypothetical protein
MSRSMCVRVIRRPVGRLPALVVVFMIFASGCLQSNPGLNFHVYRTYWVLVVQEDAFVAYKCKGPASPEDPVIPALPPAGCSWHRIGDLKAFVDKELWVPQTVVILIAVREREFYADVAEWLVREAKVDCLVMPPLSSLKQRPEVVEYRRVLSQLEREPENECYTPGS